MSLLKVIAYICSKYPYKADLSKARLNKILYLSDWKSALEKSSSITGINWKFNHYGPYVDEIVDLIRNNPDFDVESTWNFYGQPKEIIKLVNEEYDIQIDQSSKEIIDGIIDKTSKLNFRDFIDLVYSTYPVVSQQKGTDLDLVLLANKYKSLKNKTEQHA